MQCTCVPCPTWPLHEYSISWYPTNLYVKFSQIVSEKPCDFLLKAIYSIIVLIIFVALGTEQNDWVKIATNTLNENTSEQSNQVEKEEADGLDSSGKGTEIEEVDGGHDYNPITNTGDYKM